MPGIGVTCNANPSTLTMFYDDFTGPDNQATADKYEYDYDIIWATMGRNGSNGILRNGFVIEGDPAAGWPVARAAESIQLWDGVGGAFQGVEYWNTLNAYNLWMNNAAGDRVIFGAIAPAPGAFFHLGAALAAQPGFAVKVLTAAGGGAPLGGTWSAPITLLKTPDFTQAGGYKNQKLEFAMQTTWPELTFGAFNEPRWYWCVECVTPAAASPQSNVNFKDWVYGYWKFYACCCELRHGDDGSGSSSSDFRHDGPHSIRFRAGPGRRWNNRITSGKVQIGTYDGSGRGDVRNPWVMIGSRAPNIRPAELFGGYIAGVMDNPTPNAQDGVLAGDTTSKGRIVGTNLCGFANWQLGTSAGTVKRLDDIRIVKPNERTGLPAVQAIRLVSAVANPATDHIFIDVTPGAGTQWAFRASDTTLDPIVGMVIGGDDVSVAQVYRNTSGAGKWNFIRLQRGGPNKMWGATTVGSLALIHDFWYLTWRGQLVGGAAAAGIVVRAVDGAGVKQIIGTLDGSGRGGFLNALSFAPVVGTIARDLFCVEDGGDGTTANPLVRDSNMTITINPADEVGWNPAYQTLTWSGPFAKRYEYDANTDSFLEHTWQRQDMECQFALPLACPVASPPVAITVDQVPLPAHGEVRFESVIPAIV